MKWEKTFDLGSVSGKKVKLKVYHQKNNDQKYAFNAFRGKRYFLARVFEDYATNQRFLCPFNVTFQDSQNRIQLLTGIQVYSYSQIGLRHVYLFYDQAAKKLKYSDDWAYYEAKDLDNDGQIELVCDPTKGSNLVTM